MAKRNASWIWMIWIAALLMLTGCFDKTPKDSFGYVNSQLLSAGVLALAFSPDGKTLASGYTIRAGSRGADIRLWDVKTGAEKATLKGHHDRIETLAFSPDGKTLASGAADRTARLWSAETGEPIHTFKTTTSIGGRPTLCILSVAFVHGGKNLAAVGDFGEVAVWNPDTRRSVGKPIHLNDIVIASAVSPNGQQIAVNKFTGRVRLIDAYTGEEMRAMEGHSDIIHAFAFSSDSSTLASGSIDSTIRLWNAYTGKPLKRLKGHKTSVLCLAFSPDGKTLASGCISLKNQTIDNLRAQKNWTEYLDRKHKDSFSDLSDETLRLWDVKTGDHLKTLNGHEGAVWSVAFSPDSKTLASGGLGRTVRLWDVKTGKLIKTLK